MENTLNIQITLNDEQLKNLIVGNINDLPKEKLQDILLQAIKEILTSQDGQKIFIEKGRYYDSPFTPTSFLQNLVAKADINDVISPVVNEAVNEFADKYPAILEGCLKSCITEMFMSQFDKMRLNQVWYKMLNEQNQ